ncbi:hypothetical protein C0J09_10965 [Bordetella avium]|uniref:hypothetical protein n=1 Tax=Bordetella avium TaxID=521 RepID=UPI000FDCBDAC|nr:hypothetical protein [Bordetella avium]AZY49599.1 hypothetical protein C0J09_10965 [Bordetella avium]
MDQDNNFDSSAIDADNEVGQPTDSAGEGFAGNTDADTEAPSAASQFLDSLTEGGENQDSPVGRQRDDLGRFVGGSQPPSAAPNAPADGATTADPLKPAAAPAQPPSREQADADLVAGIKSERGRARVQSIIDSRNQAEQHLTAVRELVSSAGLTAESFGQHIEFARMVNSNDPQDLQQAAQMLEQARADLYRRLGQDAPGFDALSDFPDLSQMVNNLEMPRDVAMEVAQLRRAQAANAQRQQAAQMQQHQEAQFSQAVAAAEQSLSEYVRTRQHEVDHPARMAAVQEYFQDPARLQEFARTYRPEQWPAAIRMLYDNVRAQAPRRPAHAPISGRNSVAGRLAPSASQSPTDRIFSHIDSLGL